MPPARPLCHTASHQGLPLTSVVSCSPRELLADMVDMNARLWSSPFGPQSFPVCIRALSDSSQPPCPGTMLPSSPDWLSNIQVFPSQPVADVEEETSLPHLQETATGEQGPHFPDPEGSGKPKWASKFCISIPFSPHCESTHQYSKPENQMCCLATLTISMDRKDQSTGNSICP